MVLTGAPWRNVGERLGRAWRSSPSRIRRLALLALVALTVYVLVRLLFTREDAQPVSFWMLFVAELISVVSLALFTYDSWRIPLVETPEPLETSVDIAIATYDEPIEILEPTVVASLRVTGVRTVWVLDDGRRPEVLRLCEVLGAKYLARADNSHAKAGNINAALPHMDAELILFLDADHVPQRDAILQMSGYFRDPKVALVQSPHDFRNRDSAQHTHGSHHEQSLFFDVLLPGREHDQAIFWCGSAALIRRSALVEVGGVATSTLSEDLHTALKLQLKGYVLRYHNKVLVTGIAPHTTADYLLQRDRWARGTLAVLTGPESPVFGRGWSVRQRIHYANNLLYYFLPLQRLLYVSVLVLALLLGWLPIGTVSPWFAGTVVLVLLLSIAASLALARGRLEVGEGASNTYLSAEIYLRALLVTALRRKSSFKVTPKSISEMDFGERFRALALPTFVAALIAISWLLRASQEIFNVALPGLSLPGSLTPFVFGVITVFTFVELAAIVPMLWREYRRRQQRYRWRFRCNLPAHIDGVPVAITDLHEAGLSFTAEGMNIAVGSTAPVYFQAALSDLLVAVKGSATVVRSQSREGDSTVYGCTVEWSTPQDRRNVIDLCYVFLAAQDRGYVEERDAQGWSASSG
jgi:cellulose synthase (UDP-forming)